jgi:hypothetical protein
VAGEVSAGQLKRKAPKDRETKRERERERVTFQVHGMDDRASSRFSRRSVIYRESGTRERNIRQREDPPERLIRKTLQRSVTKRSEGSTILPPRVEGSSNGSSTCFLDAGSEKKRGRSVLRSASRICIVTRTETAICTAPFPERDPRRGGFLALEGIKRAFRKTALPMPSDCVQEESPLIRNRAIVMGRSRVTPCRISMVQPRTT